jgi:hypothetical protein
VKNLYLEERIALARKALNEQTRQFEDAMPESMRKEFHDFVLSVMTLLEGDAFGEAQKQLFGKELKP